MIGIFDWPIQLNKSSFDPSKNMYVAISSFGLLILANKSIGQRIWDIVRSYCEHVFESIGNLMGTHREQQKSNTLPHSPKIRNYGCNHPIVIVIVLSITRGVSHCGLAIYIKKYFKVKEEELWKLKYFTVQKYNLKKNALKILQDIITLITNLKFQHKLKYHLSKILI